MKHLLVGIALMFGFTCFAQKDTLIVKPGLSQLKTKPKEPLPRKPGVSIVRSALIPGWGQATNKKYWKIPIVYAALGTTAWLFVRNLDRKSVV